MSSVGAAGAVEIAAAGSLALVGTAVLLRAALAVLVRMPLLAAWTQDLRAPGAARTRAAWSAAVVALAIALVAFGAFRVFGWAHTTYRFHDADAIGAVVVGIFIALATGLTFALHLLDRRVRPRLPAGPLDGRRGTGALGVALALGVILPTLAIRRAVPAFDVAPVTLGLLLIAALVAAMLVRAASWRAARWGALAGWLGAVAGTWALGSLPRARLAIVEHGAPSKLTAQLVWMLADRDGDGFAGPSVGGADCDDGNAARHPGAVDIPGNGIDENCTGADATPSVPSPAVAGTATARPNIILVSVDALRTDRIGAYGYTRKTPVLDALAASGVRFSHAYTSCPSTRCAIPALHTARFHPAPDAPTLAGQLRAAGYDTAAITCCERFATAEEELAGFRTIDATADAVRMQRPGQSNADIVVDRAIPRGRSPGRG
jgi:hypothetical protein